MRFLVCPVYLLLMGSSVEGGALRNALENALSNALIWEKSEKRSKKARKGCERSSLASPCGSSLFSSSEKSELTVNVDSLSWSNPNPCSELRVREIPRSCAVSSPERPVGLRHMFARGERLGRFVLENETNYGITDVSVGLSLAMTVCFLTLCLVTVCWIFNTGYRLKA
jgi:hypothetical protein